MTHRTRGLPPLTTDMSAPPARGESITALEEDTNLATVTIQKAQAKLTDSIHRLTPSEESR